MNRTSCWQLTSPVATLNSDRLSAEVDVSRPDLGLVAKSFAQTEIEQNLVLAFSHIPPVQRKVVDQYVRANDLVGTYKSDDQGKQGLQLTDQVYWRHLKSNQTGLWEGVELVVSLQTDLLGLAPRVQLQTSFRNCEVLAVNDENEMPTPISRTTRLEPQTAAVLLQSRSDHWSYLQSLHFTDNTSCESIQVDIDRDVTTVNTTLFVEHLEKGVIRRARIRGAFCETSRVSNDLFLQWFQQFAESELPLTV
jgi:hypothetical protein